MLSQLFILMALIFCYSAVGYGQQCIESEDPLYTFTHSWTPSVGEGNPASGSCAQTNIHVEAGQRLLAVQIKRYFVADWNCPFSELGCSGSYSFSLSIVGGVFLASGSAAYPSGGASGSNCNDFESSGTIWTECKDIHIFNIAPYTSSGSATISYSATWTSGNFFNPIGFQVDIDPTFRFSITNTKNTFVPMDRSDNSFGACNGSAELGCTSNHQVSIGGLLLGEEMKRKVTFELHYYDGISGDRPGVSSNKGSAEETTAHDYIFPQGQTGFDNPGSNAREITTSEAVSSATVLVDSRDYGGIGILQAKIEHDGSWIYAEVDPYDIDYQEVAVSNCASTSKAGLFAQLPIDRDCNWIADTWEAFYLTAPQSMDRYEDMEATTQTPPAGYVRGDGFGAYDEYRGFHVVTADGATHIRTNPKKLDTFFNDDTGARGQFSKAVRDLVGAILSGPAQSGPIAFHEVSGEQFQAVGSVSQPLNKNSEVGEVPLLKGFVNILAIGTSIDTHCSNPKKMGGTIGGKHGDAIRICLAKIETTVPPSQKDALIAHTVAHEYGHRLGLDHYLLEVAYHGQVSQGIVPTVPGDKYAVGSAPFDDQLFVKMNYWVAASSSPGGSPIPTMLDEIVWGMGGLYGLAPVSGVANPSPYSAPASAEVGQVVHNWARAIADRSLDDPDPPPPPPEVTVHTPIILLKYDRYYLMSSRFFAPAFDELLENHQFAPAGKFFSADDPGDVAKMQPNRVSQ